jgi:Uma2 family endonuclease
MTTQVRITADELLRMPADDTRRELVRGELREMTPAGSRHGRIAARLLLRLGAHVEREALGVTFAAETGFELASDPDTVRAADASFIRKERIETAGDPEGFWPGAPDLAAEVVSPGDSYREVHEKVLEWLAAGSRMVLVLDPASRTVTVYRSVQEVRVLGEQDILQGADVVPGWEVPVAELFA